MKNKVEIDEYIFKMLLDCEFDVYAVLVAFSELYNVKIHIFDLLGSWRQITRISTKKWENNVGIFFSKDHYDSVTLKNNENNFILF